MSGVRGRKREESRQRAIDAAMRLFDERGIDATSMDDIAREAGLSRGTMFNYFPYKEAILVEIGARFVADIAQQASGQQRRSARNALYDLADGVAAIAERHANLVPHIAREMTHPVAARREFAASRMRYPMLYEALLAHLAEEGKVRSRARLRSYGRQLVDLTTGALVRAGNDFPMEELRTELRANVDVFWEGAVTPD